GLTIPFLAPVGVLLIFKIFGANLMRLWLRLVPSAVCEGTAADCGAQACDRPTEAVPASGQGSRSAYAACIDGMRRGWQLGIGSLLPNIMLAFAIIAVLKETGLLAVLSEVFRPAMSVFGLPGEAVTVLAASWLSGVGGAGIAASLYAQGSLTPQELTILVPGLYLMGAQIQYMGRILSVAGTNTHVYPVLFAISVVNSAAAMLFMRYFVV
ncbi:MAG: YjiG family protein, partial [Mailhella sp.]|nr:YjiG family protein [Mailhella sp.]